MMMMIVMGPKHKMMEHLYIYRVVVQQQDQPQKASASGQPFKLAVFPIRRRFKQFLRRLTLYRRQRATESELVELVYRYPSLKVECSRATVNRFDHEHERSTSSTVSYVLFSASLEEATEHHKPTNKQKKATGLKTTATATKSMQFNNSVLKKKRARPRARDRTSKR